MVVNFREHVGQQAIGDGLHHHVAVSPSAELMGFRETVFPQLPKVAAGQSFRKIVVELRVCVAIEVQAEILVTGCCITRRGKIQVGPVEVFRTFGGSLQAAGKPIDRQHLQVRCLPGTSIFRCVAFQEPEKVHSRSLDHADQGSIRKNSSMFSTAACSSEQARRNVSRSSAGGPREIRGSTVEVREVTLCISETPYFGNGTAGESPPILGSRKPSSAACAPPFPGRASGFGRAGIAAVHLSCPPGRGFVPERVEAVGISQPPWATDQPAGMATWPRQIEYCSSSSTRARCRKSSGSSSQGMPSSRTLRTDQSSANVKGEVERLKFQSGLRPRIFSLKFKSLNLS